MRVLPFDVLLKWVLKELEARDSIFGIHRSHFFVPRSDAPYAADNVFGKFLATPLGPAAGPHTQLAQNIVCAWLCGGRFIELKTVQVRDELEIPKPCIDMEDEGYNVEWSQELRLEQSAREYTKAWALIHILHRLLGHEKKHSSGTVFNISVGYNLEGIRDRRLTRFLGQMSDASEELSEFRTVLETRFPQFGDIEIPSQIANSVTLSTMHGCPPQEIEQIARYLMEEVGLHTIVKLNPTLLGRKEVLKILHDDLGFLDIQVPDAALDHDLGYPQAVELIRTLRQTAARCGLIFGIKLCNTLPAINHKKILPGEEMYMSGRALYPLTLSLLLKLTDEFLGDLKVSYSGGADALNVCTLLAAGAFPITMASDLLKPGGYGRITQYLENLEHEMLRLRATSLADLWAHKRSNLEHAVADALSDPRYQKRYYVLGHPKVESGLELFDCIVAPCVEKCAVHQDVPEYAWLISRGEYDRALEVILSRNPLPGVTGYICTQLCQTCCTRSGGNYDQPVAIRQLKRFAVEKGRIMLPSADNSGRKIAIVGSGPAGLSAAYFLALNSFKVTIFEARDEAGGMMSLAPAFRLPAEIIQEDVDRILKMGVELRLSSPLCRPPEELLKDGFDAVFIASGFQKDAVLPIAGIQGPGVTGALDFLRRTRTDRTATVGPKVLVVGGGNTAIDAARVARRITGIPPTVVYRRTRLEMPAGFDELEEAIEEGILLEELATPIRVIREEGRVVALECIRNEMGDAGPDGRRRPVALAGSEFRLQADSIIIAVGQSPDLAFLDGSKAWLHREGALGVDPATGLACEPEIYAGGDAVRGPSSIINACADGRRAAESICEDFGVSFQSLRCRLPQFTTNDIRQVKRARARRENPHYAEDIPPHQRLGFQLVEASLSESAARAEANRCLQCSVVCDKCVEVCPNRANQTYQVSPARLVMPILACTNGKFTLIGESIIHIRQSAQIVHLHDLCNDCGNCATFCVHKGKPYQDKPRLFFRKQDFDKESDNAFYLEKGRAGWTIHRREKRRECRLAMDMNRREAVYEDDFLSATFSRENFGILALKLKESYPGELVLTAPGEMYVIAEGIINSHAFPP